MIFLIIVLSFIGILFLSNIVFLIYAAITSESGMMTLEDLEEESKNNFRRF